MPRIRAPRSRTLAQSGSSSDRTGKTVVAAFDFKRFYEDKQRHARLLFVAHRKEFSNKPSHISGRASCFRLR